jgi:photosystem II stability/assembly factor-like uncharacterized protein
MNQIRPLMPHYITATLLLLVFCAPAAAQLPIDKLDAMQARSIGPAGMSGRVTAIDVVRAQPDSIFAGAATGGVWRTENGGITWTPVFDEQPMLGIGAVKIFQPDPRIVWAGAGEGNPRNSAGVGNGIYKSTDFGESWQHLGLSDSERIHRIITHPTNPDIVWAGVMGPAWSDGEQRGVFKTTDGGQSWRKVLYVNAGTGVADLVIDPSNPDKLFAAMWEFRRWPWFFNSGGPRSGLYVSEDAGETWRRLTAEDGLPEGELGRIGIAISQSNPAIVTALVEAEKSALIRSRDGGRSWATLNDEPGIAPRPFYYADIRVHPTDPNTLYSLHSNLQISRDEGKTWKTVVPSQKIHGDIHELWIGEGGGLLLQGNDGGIGISRDGGDNWRFVENLPVAQFYHLDVDDAIPFNVYGGMQDNGSWMGPSAVWESRGIRNLHWTRVGSGDGFRVMDDPTVPAAGYSMSQGGSLRRFNRLTGERKDIEPISESDSIGLRFHWNAALAMDPFDPHTLYYGSQFLHRSADRGDSWQVISPDLTTNDPEKQRQAESGGLSTDNTGAENHTTILTIAPNPVQQGVIWVGTDDGNVQLTRDGGASWSNVRGRIRGVPDATWVPHIEASKHDAGAAFVVFDNHRRGDGESYIYTTSDFGQSWRSLATPDVEGFVHTLEQDPEVPGLLFLGTEFGLYASTDAGAHWTKWTHGVPPAPVRGLVVHPRDGDLAVGTHGRAAYVLDDIRPLRAIATEPTLTDRPLHLFQPPVAWQHETAELPGYRSTGDAMFEGENRPYGALFSVWAAGATAGDSATVEVRNSAGDLVRTMRISLDSGLNRTSWDLTSEPAVVPPDPGDEDDDGGSVSGPQVLPGRYSVRVTAGGATSEQPLEVRFDPRVADASGARQLKQAALVRAHGLLRQGYALLGDATAGEERERLDEALREVRSVYSSLGSSWDAPTAMQRARLERAERKIEPLVAGNR